MAEKPYKFTDRRGLGTSFPAGNNQLIKAATQSTDRKATPNSNYDFHRNISVLGWRQLRSVSNFLFANFGMIQGALLEQAELSASTFIPQFTGADKEWGKQAEQMLMEHGRIMDLGGWPSDDCNYRKNLIIGARRDGDHATLLTENADGYPFIQVIENHRIGNWTGETVVTQDGPYKGLRIINGVIVNDFMTPVAYRVYDEPLLGAGFRDVPADSLILSYFPTYPNQKRGLPSMASNAFDWSDVSERRAFELLAQKVGASITIIEENEAGEPPPGQTFVERPASTDTTTGTPTGLITESYDGGTIRYIKSGGREAIKAFNNDRPSANAQAFEEAIIRGAFYGMEWCVDFALDPSKVGGAPMRVVVEKINSTIRKNQALVEKVMRKIDGWRISKFVKLGLLPENVDWYKWTYQGPAEVTADAKYDSDIDLQEIRAGIGTRRRACARRGEFWEEVDEQKEVETDSLLARAQKLSKKYKITIQEAITLLNLPTPNGNLGGGGPAPADEGAVDFENLKQEFDSFGVGVRAGALTPTVSDEEHFRTKAGLPPITAEAKTAWGKEDNVRRPITLTQIGGGRVAPGGGNVGTEGEQ